MRLVIGWTFLLLLLLGFGGAAASGWAFREPYKERVQRLGRLRQKFLYYHQPRGVPAALAAARAREAVTDHLRSARALLDRLAIIRDGEEGARLLAKERGEILAEVVTRQRRLRSLAVAPRLPAGLLRPVDDKELRDDEALTRRLESLIVVEEGLLSLSAQPELELLAIETGGPAERPAHELIAVAAARDIPLKVKVRGPREAVDAWLRAIAADVDRDEDRTPFFLASIRLGFLTNSAETFAELSLFALAIEMRAAEDVTFAPAETEAEALGEEE